MNALETTTSLIYLVAAACFVLGLHLMNSPATARRGNQLSAAGMVLAIAATIAVLADQKLIDGTGLGVLIAGALIGSAAGLWMARSVQMTAMPQLVSLFNAVGGGAAMLVAFVDIIPKGDAFDLSHAGTQTLITAVLDVAIGAITLSGSLIATGKLQGIVSGQPIIFPGSRLVTLLSALVVVGGGITVFTGGGGLVLLGLVAVAGLVFGVTLVLPIGGADMPVVISLLNAFTGTAVAMAGFILNSTPLITAGALVGASGAILTKLMADAMNRSLFNIMVGGFGTGDAQAAAAGGGGAASVRTISADDAAIQLGYASKVVIVPGYGLAAGRAQHELVALADSLRQRGVEVTYAIHPVAGRMPGHMNVLLAEANVPYELMKELEEANPEFSRTDVALVVGANDVTNPAARRPGTAISGMPILDVDHANSVIVIKRSMGHGYAGIDNELYSDPKTGMLFADAKQGLSAITAMVEEFVS